MLTEQQIQDKAYDWTDNPAIAAGYMEGMRQASAEIMIQLENKRTIHNHELACMIVRYLKEQARNIEMDIERAKQSGSCIGDFSIRSTAYTMQTLSRKYQPKVTI